MDQKFIAEANAKFGKLTEECQIAILDILAEFDFAKVQRVMEFVDWEYYDGLPEVGDLINTAKMLLVEVCGGTNGFCATGGFEAEVVDGVVVLKFVLEESEYNTYDYVS